MTPLPNPFLNPSASDAAGATAAATAGPHRPTAAAVPNSVSPGVVLGLCPRGEIEPSVTTAYAPGESTDCIAEIFHFSRQRAAEMIEEHDRRSEAFWADYRQNQQLRALYDALDPPQPPLFLQRPSITDMRPDNSLAHIFKVHFGMDA